MNSKDFVKKKIDELVLSIPYIKCTYQFDEFDSTHYIKVEPKQYYEINDLYMSKEDEIINQFIELFPYEGIVFITENDKIDINNPIYSREGMLFDIFSKSLLLNFADIDINKEFLPSIKRLNNFYISLSDILNLNINFNITSSNKNLKTTKNLTNIKTILVEKEEEFFIDHVYSSAA